MKRFSLFILLLFLPINLLTQSHSFGLFSGSNFNFHRSNFQKLPGFPNCCPTFENGKGNGPNFALEFSKEIFQNYFFAPRLGYHNLNGLLKKPEKNYFIIDLKVIEGEFEHRLYAYLNAVYLEPMVLVKPLSFLSLSAGVNLSYLLKSKFHQEEVITKPANGVTFLDSNGKDTGSRLRNVYDGEIPNVQNLQPFFVSRIGAEFPLTKKNNFTIAPEISFYLPLQNLAKDLDWKISSISIGLSIRYYPASKKVKNQYEERFFKVDTIIVETHEKYDKNFIRGKEDIREVVFETDTTILRRVIISRTDTLIKYLPPKIDCKITLFAIDSNGKEIKNPKIRIEEYRATRTEPLLNYIFFDEGSGNIPDRYVKLSKENISQFNIDSLYKNSTLDIYYNIMNIIGKRLVNNPTAKIRLIGCNSNIGIEKNNIELSKKRAESVKTYLVETWGIAPQRIEISARNLPQKSSLPAEDTLKAQENRRVEIYSDSPEILIPLTINTIERKSNFDALGYKISVNSDTLLKSSVFRFYANGTLVFSTTSTGGYSSQEKETFALNEIIKKVYLNNLKFIGKLQVENILNEKCISEDSITNIDVVSFVETKQITEGEYKVDYYRLILFDFDKWNIEGTNQWIVNFIKSKVKPNSEVEIYGSTDIIGDEGYNKILSQKRAEAVCQAIGKPNAKAIGLGEEKLEFPNNFPEGRFYCRNVLIIIRTPIN